MGRPLSAWCSCVRTGSQAVQDDVEQARHEAGLIRACLECSYKWGSCVLAPKWRESEGEMDEGDLRLKHIHFCFPLFKQQNLKQVGDSKQSIPWWHKWCWIKLVGVGSPGSHFQLYGKAVCWPPWFSLATHQPWSASHNFPGQHLPNMRMKLVLAKPTYPGSSLLPQKDSACRCCKP